ncbi:similar to Saccharomyces cerevisiae YEL018W EAF5 Esa1p-associated factor, non-essential subunit of the NuA4 acetyltransferase complex [Maudiozyma saulgeensis]|uniref:Similar to Saccharomyces cerevisiae YEL018W EAF5 Esa1p-associated factor, non-essential subunit of the NuA4 acetyltransferase complex n=1 Tax=Maudiozyma saulgeensis TaxID=1789683 RepID=A0A1X7R965_9SACH|nr:similar to Saccharomyces cerevisiae YEL018W EAF5 Esa1p-associated factor, non-essential subunit of the NuA4 acetyltransferase complex [Kazachstania saulgeensis]
MVKMVDPIVKELIVLQIIYALLLPKIKQDPHIHDNNHHDQHNGTDNDTHGQRVDQTSSGEDSIIISGNIKLSLVKLTNEIQNNVLVNEIMAVSNPTNKLNIHDVLKTVNDLFPLQRIVISDGQLSFHNLKVAELKMLIMEKYSQYRNQQVQYIKKLDNDILQELEKVSNVPATANTTTVTTTTDSHENKKQRTSSVPLDTHNTQHAKVQSPVTTKSRTGTPEGSITMRNVDPKREKLLQLYRDTVLNKLQSKNKILDKLYNCLDNNGSSNNSDSANTSRLAVRELLNLEKIKATTPVSVNHLQLILQKSVSDGIMGTPTGSTTWVIARQMQTELDDTVQFMRRALE